ncbi:YfiR family protein [bacterium]|nr:YfiR family protein [bacterium]
MKWFRWKIILFIVLTGFVLWAQEEVRMDLQVNLLLKILKYDRNISQRGTEGLKLGVLYNPDNKKSLRAKQDFEKKFNSLDDKSIKDIQILLIPIKGFGELSKSIKSYGINLLYIAPGFDNEISKIIDICSTNKILTMTGVPAYTDNGIAVGLGIKNGKPEIIINTTVSKSIGADFSSNILKLARVIK